MKYIVRYLPISPIYSISTLGQNILKIKTANSQGERSKSSQKLNSMKPT
uniref:Uncharacterized protein n=1 Tax=viral metagenome TaxID=1070528 RepID=A0A6C0D703_9ZZZZ